MLANRITALAAATAALSISASAQIVFVDADLPTGANDGTSWADAFRGSAGLHAAFAAATPGSELWVAGGTYVTAPMGQPEVAFFLGENQVALRGGFLGVESSPFERPEIDLHPTTLSGDLAGNDDGSVALAQENANQVLGG